MRHRLHTAVHRRAERARSGEASVRELHPSTLSELEEPLDGAGKLLARIFGPCGRSKDRLAGLEPVEDVKSNCSTSAVPHFRTAFELRQLCPCGPNQAVAAAPKIEADGILALPTDDHTGRLAVDRAAQVSEIVTDAVERRLERGATQRVMPLLFLELPDDLDHNAILLRASLTSVAGPHAPHKVLQVLWFPGLLDHCG